MAADAQPDRFGDAAMVGVLGPILFVAPGGPTSPPSAAQRRLIAILALHAPEPLRAERLADLLEVSPSGLRTTVARLRRVLGENVVVSNAGCYRLAAAVDADLFAQELVALTVASAPDADDRLRALERALSLWHGPAYDEFAHEQWAAGEAARLNELHAAATEDHAEALVDAHRWSDAIAELSVHIARHPLRDRPRGLLMRALAGDGRQADALRACREYRRLLAEEVGTEPSPVVQLIERRIAGGWTGTSSDTEPRAARKPPLGGLPTALAVARHGPFVGRAATIDDLEDTWRTGVWRALIVAGEPGIGKTRLLAELAHRMHEAGHNVAVARGDEDFAVSYRPWGELLDPVVRSISPAELASLRADQLGALARVLPVLQQPVDAPLDRSAGDHDAQRALILDAILALLRTAGPTVLVLDDLHWIDTPSLGILRHVLAAAIPELTVVAAYRDTDVAPNDPLASVLADLRRDDGVRRVALDGIDGAAVVALVERSTGRPLDAATISLGHAIRARTAGNPLFAGELIKHLVEQQSGVQNEDELESGARDVPAGLVEIIGRRLARLGEPTVDVLRVAAAVGQHFDVGVVEETVTLGRAHNDAAATTDVLSRLEEARDAGVVDDDDDGMSFRHAVIRSALLDPMSAVRRQRLHRDIATVLERLWASSLDRHLEALAYHHDRARSAEAPRWYRRAAAAAANALDPNAADLADRGLELLTSGSGDDELRCDLLIVRAIGLRLAGREAIADARQATDAAIAIGDQERIASALLSLSVRAIDRESAEHLAFLTAGLAHLTDADRVSRWHVAAELSIRSVMGPSGNAADHRCDLLDVVDHLDPSDVRSCQIAMRCARSLIGINEAPVAAEIVERFATNCNGVDSDGLPVELAESTMWLHLGDRDASDRQLAAAARDPRRHHWLFDCQVRQRQVMRDLLDGHWADAASGVAEIRDRAAQDASILLGCSAQLGWLRREIGDVERSYNATSALAAARPGIALLQAVLASDAAEAGELAVARDQLARLSDGDVDAGSARMTVMALGHLAWAAVTVDARELAPELRRRLAPYSGELGVIGTGVYVLGAVDRILGGLAALEGDDDVADQLFTAARELERNVRSPPLQARTAHWWGRARLRRGDTDGARALLAEARASALDLGMTALVAQVDALVEPA